LASAKGCFSVVSGKHFFCGLEPVAIREKRKLGNLGKKKRSGRATCGILAFKKLIHSIERAASKHSRAARWNERKIRLLFLGDAACAEASWGWAL
jgi:hypothetical protein